MELGALRATFGSKPPLQTTHPVYHNSSSDFVTLDLDQAPTFVPSWSEKTSLLGRPVGQGGGQQREGPQGGHREREEEEEELVRRRRLTLVSTFPFHFSLLMEGPPCWV